ncbi:MAG TPA: hypothetical protein VGB79_01755 [Allosphingosinicella sp.]|jgi:HK97 gp10 family phage protein
MVNWRTRTEGLDRYNAKVGAMPAAVREAIAKTQAKTADDFIARLRTNTPMHEKAPHLRDTIRKEVVAGQSLAVGISIGNDDLPYAAPLEFGHLTKGGKHVPAQPFFFPVVRIMNRRYRNRVRYAVKKALRKLMGLD